MIQLLVQFLIAVFYVAFFSRKGFSVHELVKFDFSILMVSAFVSYFLMGVIS